MSYLFYFGMLVAVPFALVALLVSGLFYVVALAAAIVFVMYFGGAALMTIDFSLAKFKEALDKAEHQTWGEAMAAKSTSSKVLGVLGWVSLIGLGLLYMLKY